MNDRNYWCYRIDTNEISFFYNELNNGKLRQGWGYDERQNLRNLTMNEGARRNLPMFKNVKKGDILLVPRLPTWGQVAIVESTEDWEIGYKFQIDDKQKDYGHIFPAKYLRNFIRSNKNVTGNLRSTLKNPSRFWNINHYSEDVEALLSVPESDLIGPQNYNDRLKSSIRSVFSNVFNEEEFTKQIYDKLNQQFSNEDWEFALTIGLQEIFPFYEVERVAGIEEKKHGTDILIKLPSLISGYQYAIAIQVKDYKGFVDNNVIDQINKADTYWGENLNLKLIDKIVVITKSKKEENDKLQKYDSKIKIIFAEDLKELLTSIAKRIIGIKEDEEEESS